MKRFNDILCVVEAEKDSGEALERAVALTETHQARLTVVSVAEDVMAIAGLPDGGPVPGDIQDAILAARADELKMLVNPYRDRIEISISVLSGLPFIEIIREVLRNRHDLVVKVAAPNDWVDRFLGSRDMHLLRKCPCPVWLIRSGAPSAVRRILAAVDVDDGYPAVELDSRRALNRAILETSCSLAAADFGELHVVHAWRAIGESMMRGALMHAPEECVRAYVDNIMLARDLSLGQLIEDTMSELGAEVAAYLSPQIHLVKGVPEKEIPNLASNLSADLIVIGTVARTGVPGFIMGNTAEAILNRINTSVLALKPPGFKTPVMLQA